MERLRRTGANSSKAEKKVKNHLYASSATWYVKVELPNDKGDYDCETIDKGEK